MIAHAHLHPYFGWLLAGAALALRERSWRACWSSSWRRPPKAAACSASKPSSAARSNLPPTVVVPVKFFGGLLAMGSGLALGREGPTVQMGASFGELGFEASLLHDEEDRRVVQAASAGAGLAVAFNAPIGGSIFVFEELTSNITPWLLVSTLAAATVAVWLMRWMLGNTLSFTVRR